MLYNQEINYTKYSSALTLSRVETYLCTSVYVMSRGTTLLSVSSSYCGSTSDRWPVTREALCIRPMTINMLDDEGMTSIPRMKATPI